MSNKMEGKKYLLDPNDIKHFYTPNECGELEQLFFVYRVIALKDIPSIGVKKGDKGGYAASEDNLSHEGDCWVGEGAVVFQNAKVTDNAYVVGRVEVYGETVLSDDSLICGED